MTFNAFIRRACAAGFALTVAAACGEAPSTIDTPECTPVDLAFPGSVNGSIGAGTCQSGGFYAALFRFTADPNFSHSFAATSSFSAVGLEVLTDPPGTNVVWVSTSSGVTAEWLLPTGTYLVRVTARNTTGDFALTGSTAPINTTACTVRALTVGVTLENHELASTDCPWLFPNGTTDGTYFDAYAIQSNEPCSIRMESATLDSFIEIRNSTQALTLGGNDDEATDDPDSFVSLVRCSYNGGPIVIRANTATAVPATGNYTLTVVLEGAGSIVAGSRNPSVPGGSGAQALLLSAPELVTAKRAKQQPR